MSESNFAVVNASNLEICKALGFDPDKVRSLVLRLQPGQVPVAEVQYFLTDKQGVKFDCLMKTYKLVKKEKENG